MNTFVLGSVLLLAAAVDDPISVKYRITGLFSPEREADLRAAAKKMTEATLSAVDYANAEVTFSYDAAKIAKGAKPEQILGRIDNELRNASNHTFTLKPLGTLSGEKLQKLEISVGMLDCKACGLGLYLILMGVPGVERAFVNFKEGLATAWIDPEKADRAKVVEALKKREIRVK